MRHRRVALLALLLTSLAVSCKKESSSGAAYTEAAPPPATEPAAAPTSDAPAAAVDVTRPAAPQDDRKIIRTGTVELRVDDAEAARAALEAQVHKAGGFLDSTQVQHSDMSTRAVLVLRVPSAGYGDLLRGLAAIGTIVAESTDATDVTDQYVDGAAHLSTARQLEGRMLELTARAGTLADVLAVERELARVRAEIEQWQGRLQHWDHDIAFSTLTVVMVAREPALATDQPGLFARIGDGLRGSIDALGDLVTGLLVLGVASLPWLAIGVPLALLARRRWRRR